jgi:O-antigen/teichoic acid export membrane protein
MTGVSILVTLLTTPLLVHGLGKTEYGVWVVVGSLMWFVPVLEFGFGGATVKYVAEHNARGDRELVRQTIATSFWLLALGTLVAGAVGVILALAFPLLFEVPPEVERPAQLLILLVTLDVALSMPMDTFGNVLVALQRYDVLNATLIAVLAAQALAWWATLEAGGGLVALGVVTVAISVLGQLSRAVIARRLTPDVTVSPRLVDRRAFGPLATLSFWLWLTTTSKLVIRRIDTVVVGLVVGVPEAAVYAIGQKLAFLADQGMSPLARVFFPYAAEQAAERDVRQLRGMFLVGTRIAVAVAGPSCLALAVLAGPAIQAWVGDGFGDAALVVVFLVATTAIKALTQIGLQVLPGAGLARTPALIVAAEAVINLSLSVVLGSTIGLEGVALATLIAAAFTHLAVLLPYIGRQFELRADGLLLSLLKEHAPPLGVAAVVAYAVTRAELESIPAVVAAGAAIAVSYLAVLSLSGLDTEERRRLLSPLRGRLGGAGSR